MGCDIHAFVEIKKNGQWQYYDWPKQFEVGKYKDGSPEYDYSQMFDHPLYIHRNYDLFAILADVRNGRGFAGIPTGTGFKPLALPRGLPTDVTPEVEAESDDWNDDGHSHSWVLLSELLAFDWDGQSTTQYGVVDIEQYRQFKESGKPQSYCGDVSGRDIVKLSNAEMDQILTGEAKSDKHYYTQVTWQESYREAAGEWWFKTLAELAKLGQPENVRLVFWFDN